VPAVRRPRSRAARQSTASAHLSAIGKSLRVAVLMGTRPEAVKLAPVVRGLQSDERFEVVVVSTGQHREMLDQVASTFGLRFDNDLRMMVHGQSLSSLTSRAVQRVGDVISSIDPDLVIVQGDTTSTFVAALSAFYHGVPTAHVEAGLRTHDLHNPYPEEANRRLTSQLTDLHLAPTHRNRENLLGEGFSADSIVVTGNTVIDALLMAVDMPRQRLPHELESVIVDGTPIVLVTAHRRESLGRSMDMIARSLRTLAARNLDWAFVFPIHRNRLVRNSFAPILQGLPNVLLVEPLPYLDFTHLMRAARIVLTDSGGIQEEAPSLGVPVLVMRGTTERPEAIEAGAVRLVGTDETAIADSVQELIDDRAEYDRMARAINPYGDGRATARILEALAWRFMAAEPRPEDFTSVSSF
jgi:UDP-N-acetylglucosamine 2-epimerase (non-hydrolysing)